MAFITEEEVERIAIAGQAHTPNTLKTVKGDKDIATDLRKEFFDALAPVAALITKANEFGFEVGFQFGPNAFGQVTIQAINIMKKY